MMESRWSPLMQIQAALALISVLSLFIEVVLLMFFEPPESSETLINVVMGAQTGVGFANVYGFFFGQKEQSNATERVAAVAAQNAGNPVVVEAPSTVEVRPGEA